MLRSLLRSSRLLPALALASALFLGPPDAAAQTRWQQTIQVIVPVEGNEMMQALVDSMTAVFEAKGAEIRRSPQAQPTPYPELEQALESDGLSMLSASHAFITYRYRLTSAELQSDILDFHFIYRPPGAQEDLSIFYIDLERTPLYDELLVERGTRIPSNEMVLRSFEQQISLHRLAERATIVRLGGEIVRDPERARAEKERILEVTAKLAHEGM